MTTKKEILKGFAVARMTSFLALILLSAAFFAMSGQSADELRQRLAVQAYNYPQEKIHVMTDKSLYITGDTVWLRAFVVDAVSHQPVDVSKFVYVELRDPMSEAVLRVKIKERDGVMKGYLALDPTTVAEGDYTLVAYTWFMRNQGERYFFKKSVRIISSYATQCRIEHQLEWKNAGSDKESLRINLRYVDAQTGEPIEYKKFDCKFGSGRTIDWLGGTKDLSVEVKHKELKDGCVLVKYGNYGKYITFPSSGVKTFDVSFYPEGGYLVPGVENKMTFKALDGNGCTIAVTGSVVDRAESTIATIETRHNGMGLVIFTPQAGKVYSAVCRDIETGESKKFKLPEIRADATVLQAETDGPLLTFTAVGTSASDAVIVAQMRGVVLDVGTSRLTLNTNTLPAGVVQALLLNDKGRVLSERLAFVSTGIDRRAAVSFDKPAYDSRQLVQASVDLSDFYSPTENFAVAIVDDSFVHTDSTTTILTDLLLQSDLQGHIANPAWYFAEPERLQDLDLLMMTQGWRRYDVPRALQGKVQEPKYAIEKGQVLNGRVLSFTKRPVYGALVKVIAPSIRFADATTTYADGLWFIHTGSFPDSTRFVVQAVNKRNSGYDNLELLNDKFPFVSSIKFPANTPNATNSDGYNYYLSNEKRRLQYIDGVTNVLLGEIVVSRRKRRKMESVYDLLALKSHDYKYFDQWEITSFDTAIRRFPGLRITQRGVLYHNELVGIFVDGTPVAGWNGPNSGDLTFKQLPRGTSSAQLGTMERSSDDAYETLLMMYPFNVVRQIDFIPPGASAGFSGYAGGILSITLKNGTEEGANRHDYTIKYFYPLGYQRPAEFYAPRYDTGNNGIDEGTDLRETLYWNPCVSADSNGRARFNFYTNDVPATSYTVTIEGVTQAGELIRATRQIKKN